MSAFSQQWLQLRESADHRSRSSFDEALPALSNDHWHIIDLGCGTGSNFRYLSALLSGAQHWVCLDHDDDLLQALVETTQSDRNKSVVTMQAELSADIAAVLERACANSAPEATLLITASALLDLVSTTWLDALIGACSQLHATALFALNYDGQMELSPAHADDGRVRNIIDEHQHTDKGFGRALGPDATRYARAAFESRGYRVLEAASDWQLDSNDAELQRELLAGWFAAASEQAGDPTELRAWYEHRTIRIDSGQLLMRVGHRDLLALPPSTPAAA